MIASSCLTVMGIECLDVFLCSLDFCRSATYKFDSFSQASCDSLGAQWLRAKLMYFLSISNGNSVS